MGGQYVTVASKITIVAWLLCEAVSWSPVRWFTQMVLYDDCYALCLPWISLGRVGPVGPALRGGVHEFGGFVCSAYCGGTLSVGFCFLGFCGAC